MMLSYRIEREPAGVALASDDTPLIGSGLPNSKEAGKTREACCSETAVQGKSQGKTHRGCHGYLTADCLLQHHTSDLFLLHPEREPDLFSAPALAAVSRHLISLILHHKGEKDFLGSAPTPWSWNPKDKTTIFEHKLSWDTLSLRTIPKTMALAE